MAERRMMAKSIIETDAFMDMPQSTQNLYFHLLLRADDDGFVLAPKRIMREVGSGDDDMRVLIGKGYLLAFDSGVIVIKHWRIHNYVQRDRYKRSILKEAEQVELNGNKEYRLVNNVSKMYPKCIQNVSTEERRLEERREEEIRGEKIRLEERREKILSSKLDGVSEKAREIIVYLNEKAGTHYKYSTPKTKVLINARLNEGFTIDAFKTVIDTKCDEWLHDVKMGKYLRPETLFGTKFESYLNERNRSNDRTAAIDC